MVLNHQIQLKLLSTLMHLLKQITWDAKAEGVLENEVDFHLSPKC